MDWFLYDRDLHHERVKPLPSCESWEPSYACPYFLIVTTVCAVK